MLKKNVAYIWLHEQQVAFDKTKEIILANLQIRAFDKLLPTRLLTDASRLNGLGYCLLQSGPDDSISLIQCGSRLLNSAESRYSTTELECLAIYFAVKDSHLLSIPLLQRQQLTHLTTFLRLRCQLMNLHHWHPRPTLPSKLQQWIPSSSGPSYGLNGRITSLGWSG